VLVFLFRFFEGLVVVVLVGGVGCSFRCFRWGSLAESSWKVRSVWGLFFGWRFLLGRFRRKQGLRGIVRKMVHKRYKRGSE